MFKVEETVFFPLLDISNSQTGIKQLLGLLFSPDWTNAAISLGPNDDWRSPHQNTENQRVTPLCPVPLCFPITARCNLNNRYASGWKWTFSAATVPRQNETQRTARAWGTFTYTLLPLPLSSSSFFLFSHSSEFWSSFSLINGATQVAHSGLHPARASLRAMSWR